jgi:GNAT superfamily N-acetyltransferase
MTIRELSEIDIRDALELVWTVFSEFEAPEYDPEGINVFREYIAYDSISEMLSAGTMHVWGSFEGDVLTGVIATRGPGHISLFFVRKEYQRRGIARTLFAVVEQYCRNLNLNSITVNSSPYAVAAYRRLGFVDTGLETVTNGMRFTPMRYNISPK